MFPGSVDCSALTPLLRDQFPELLSTLSIDENNACHTEKFSFRSDSASVRDLVNYEQGKADYFFGTLLYLLKFYLNSRFLDFPMLKTWLQRQNSRLR